MSPAPKKQLNVDREFLASYLPFLLNRVSREMLRGVNDKFAQHDLTVWEWRILAVLSDRGTCRFGELVDLTSIVPATLARITGNLDERGLILRRRPLSDARTVRITLTAKGAAAFASTVPWALEVERTLTQGLSVAETRQLKKLLTVMFKNIRSGNFPSMGKDEHLAKRTAVDADLSEACE